MALMPGAQWRPMPGSSTQRISSYDLLIFHTCVGSLAGTDGYFRRTASGTNSHFGVGGDGTIYQWVDTAYRSGASLNGNYHAISVETADMGAEFPAWNTNDGNAVPAWTEAQLDANARIAKWVHETHGIQLVEIPDSKPTRRGVGYHRLGVPGYMVAGGEQWSTARGKVCPGNRRIAQVPEVIRRASTAAIITKKPVIEGDDMYLITADGRGWALISGGDYTSLTATQSLALGKVLPADKLRTLSTADFDVVRSVFSSPTESATLTWLQNTTGGDLRLIVSQLQSLAANVAELKPVPEVQK